MMSANMVSYLRLFKNYKSYKKLYVLQSRLLIGSYGLLWYIWRLYTLFKYCYSYWYVQLICLERLRIFYTKLLCLDFRTPLAILQRAAVRTRFTIKLSKTELLILFKKIFIKRVDFFPNQYKTRPAWAGFKTAEEGRTKIMLIYT